MQRKSDSNTANYFGGQQKSWTWPLSNSQQRQMTPQQQSSTTVNAPRTATSESNLSLFANQSTPAPLLFARKSDPTYSRFYTAISDPTVVKAQNNNEIGVEEPMDWSYEPSFSKYDN
eukprot:scpid95262/ scgid17396/ 